MSLAFLAAMRKQEIWAEKQFQEEFILRYHLPKPPWRLKVPPFLPIAGTSRA
jgi:hypothetical protein